MSLQLGNSLAESADFLCVTQKEKRIAAHGWSYIRPHMLMILNDFYSSLPIREALDEIRRFDLQSLKNKQVDHWDHLFCENHDEFTENELRRIGNAHQRHDVPITLFILSYGWFLNEFERVLTSLPESEIDVVASLSAMRKVVFMDLATTSSTYTAHMLD